MLKLKATVKSKVSHNKREKCKTGGGIPNIQKLNNLEERLADTMGHEVLFGLDGGVDTNTESVIVTGNYNLA